MMRIHSKKKKDESSNGDAATPAPPPVSPEQQRALMVQRQVRSLRRRLWHAFATEDAQTALRAYKATARDLEEWIQEEIEEARKVEAVRIQQEKEKKDAQKPAMFKKLGHVMNNKHDKKQEKSLAKTSPKASIEKPKKSPPASNNNNGNHHSISPEALLPMHINPSDPFLLEDYENPFYDIDPETGEAYCRAARREEASTMQNPLQPLSNTRQYKKATKKKRRRRASTSTAPRTSFWATLRRRGEPAMAAAASASSEEGSLDPSESTTQYDISQTGGAAAVLLDPKMTTPLHEAARMGNSELVQLMLSHAMVEPNFKNGQKRTALHMVAGGRTGSEAQMARVLQRKMEAKKNHKQKRQAEEQSLNPTDASNGNDTSLIGIAAPTPVIIEPADGSNTKENSATLGAKKAARAMGRFFQSTLQIGTKDAMTSKQSTNGVNEQLGYAIFDEDKWNKFRTERMDCVMAILSWSHPDDGSHMAGEGASVNAVDARGRTALHYAAELGREDVCMAVLSSFGAMLTVVDDSARTPCELAAEQNHPELAAQLGARALLHVDPYGMDDELLAAVLADQVPFDDVETTDDDVGGTPEIDKARKALVAPFSWCRTMTMENVDKMREKRLGMCYAEVMAEIERRDGVREIEKAMYGMKIEDADVDQLTSVEADADSDCSDDANPSNVAGGGVESESWESASIEGEGEENDNEAESPSSGEATNDQDEETETETVPPPNAAAEDAGQSQPAVEPSETDEDQSSAKKTNDLTKQGVAKPEVEDGSGDRRPADEVRKKEDENLQMLHSLLLQNVAQLLSFHGWIVQDAVAAFKDSPCNALEHAGVQLKEIHVSPQNRRDGVEGFVDEESKVCQICFEVYDKDMAVGWTNLAHCSHSFCNSCLGDYLSDCAESKSTGLLVPCPHHECVVPLEEDEIRKLAPNSGVFSSLRNTANENFVISANDLRFCPHPGCSGVVKIALTASMKAHGIDWELLHVVGATCTAVHGNNEEEKIEGDYNGGTLPITYEGVIDPTYVNCRCITIPKRSHRFCYGCGENPVHFPVSCDILGDWKQKMAEEVSTLQGENDPEGGTKYDDIAQQLWMKANTRPCPKCKAPIEKNEGCNHMTCSNPQCKHEFCWICRKDWKLHSTSTGGFFRCNRWTEDEAQELYDAAPDKAEAQAAVAALNDEEAMSNPHVMVRTYGTALHATRMAHKKSKEMQRFLHHYTRWNAHGESAALEKMMSENVCTRLAPVVQAAAEFTCNEDFDFDGKGLSFVHAAFTELLECRSVLQHSYAFSFFQFALSSKRHRYMQRMRDEKAAFETLQSELEIVTEQMSDIVARAHLRATQTQILFLTTGAAERRIEFMNLMFILLSKAKRRKKEEENPPQSRSFSLELAPASVSTSNNPAVDTAGLVVQETPAPNEDTADGEDEEGGEAEEVEQALRASLEAFTDAVASTIEAAIQSDGSVDDHILLAEEVYADDDDDDSNVDEEEEQQFADWACSACTYMNSGGQHCAMCGTPVGS